MSEGLSDRHAALGAVLREDGTVDAYGSAGEEYRTVREAAGFVHRSDRATIRMWGRDPVRMLNGLITNQLPASPSDRAVYGAMLTPKGRVITDLRAFVLQREGSVEVRIDLPLAALPSTRDHLKKYVPPLFARWADLSDSDTVIGVYGPASDMAIRAILGDAPGPSEDDLADLPALGQRVVAVRTKEVGGLPGIEIFGPATLLGELWAALERLSESTALRPVGFEALEALRVEAGRPRFGAELTDETLPAEAYESTGLMGRAISFTKGCYTGQEVVVRIAHRGHVNRLLRGLLLPGGELPAARTALHHPESGKVVGWTTTAVRSPLAGGPIALAYLRREVEPGGAVRIGPEGPIATVVPLPFTSPEADPGESGCEDIG